MKRLILAAFLATGLASQVSAHGFYVGLGYGMTAPKLTASKGSCYSGYQYCYPEFEEYLTTWPSIYYNGPGDWFDYGGVENWTFNTDSSSTILLAAGWDFPFSPFRMELEYGTTSFSVKSVDLTVSSMGDITLDDDGYPAWDHNDDYYADEYPFDYSFSGMPLSLDIKTTTMMLNTYFEIPGFDNIDPYVGFGIGTYSMEVSGGWLQPSYSEDYFMPGFSGACGYDDWADGVCDGSVGIAGAPANMIKGVDSRLAFQLMAGVEYRVPESPYIIGVEYRSLKVDAPDKDNYTGGKPSGDKMYVWDNWNITYDHTQLLIKGRYDFISDEY